MKDILDRRQYRTESSLLKRLLYYAIKSLLLQTPTYSSSHPRTKNKLKEVYKSGAILSLDLTSDTERFEEVHRVQERKTQNIYG